VGRLSLEPTVSAARGRRKCISSRKALPLPSIRARGPPPAQRRSDPRVARYGIMWRARYGRAGFPSSSRPTLAIRRCSAA